MYLRPLANFGYNSALVQMHRQPLSLGYHFTGRRQCIICHFGDLDAYQKKGFGSLANDFSARHYAFEGCFNFRDIGGYQGSDGRTVRWRRYFRAGRQDRMTPADLTRAGDLAIATQIDLRRPDEIRDQGRGPLQTLGARYEGLALIPEGGSQRLDKSVGVGISGHRYLRYLDFEAAPWRRVFELLADAQRHPVLIHCTAGKDRTGVITALTLSLLGVDRSVIEEDYALTNRDVPRQVDFVEQGPGLPEGVTREAMIRTAGVPAEAIGVFLDGLESEHGGPHRYLRNIGVDDDCQNAIRDALLERR